MILDCSVIWGYNTECERRTGNWWWNWGKILWESLYKPKKHSKRAVECEIR